MQTKATHFDESFRLLKQEYHQIASNSQTGTLQTHLALLAKLLRQQTQLNPQLVFPTTLSPRLVKHHLMIV